MDSWDDMVQEMAKFTGEPTTASIQLKMLYDAGVRFVPEKATGDMILNGGGAQELSIGSWGEPELVFRHMVAATPLKPGEDT